MKTCVESQPFLALWDSYSPVTSWFLQQQRVSLVESVFMDKWLHPTENYHVQMESFIAWWRHQMETFSALLAICAGNSPVTGEFPAQRPVTRSFDGLFDLLLNKRLSKQWWGWWFETPSCPLGRHCNFMLKCRVKLCQQKRCVVVRHLIAYFTEVRMEWTKCLLTHSPLGHFNSTVYFRFNDDQ